MTATSAMDLGAKLEIQRKAFRAHPNRGLEDRNNDLKRLLAGVIASQEELIAAADEDFGGRSRQETLLTEICTTTNAIRHAQANLASWARPRRRAVSYTLQPG